MKVNWMTASFLALSFAAPTQFAVAEVYDRIKVVVYNQVITEQEIAVRTQAKMQGSADFLLGTDAVALEVARGKVINQLVEEALIQHRAEELAVQVNAAEVEAEVGRFRKKNRLSELAMEDVLEKQQTTLAEFKRTIRDQIARRQVMQREVDSQISINEGMLKSDYLADAPHTTEVHARHLLLLLPKGSTAKKEAAVLAKIKSIRQSLVAGADFGETAVKFSQDPTVSSNQGDLGFFKQQDMDPEFSAIAFSITPGHLSDAVRTRFGYHLIEVLSKEERPEVPFATVRDRLYKKAYDKEYKILLAKYLSNLTSKAKITYR